MAHSNQEKLVSLERQSSDFQNQVQLLEGKLNMVQNSYTTEVEKNKQFTEIIAQKEIELNEVFNTSYQKYAIFTFNIFFKE